MWKRIRIAIVVALITTALLIGSQLKAQPFQTYPEQRCVKNEGYGMIINDLECHARAGHPMRNEKDPGNWVHELCHQVSSDIRCKTKANDNAIYLLNNHYVIFVEPDVTLKQVAAMVHKTRRTETWKLYLVEQQRYWNREPLYILDEGNAFAMSVLYHTMAGTEDPYRYTKAKEFIYFSEVLLKAVKYYDPDYAQLEDLEAFIKYQNNRVNNILKLYDYEGGGPVPDEIIPDELPVPDEINPDLPIDYVFSGASYHNRGRTKKFFKKAGK